jgi:hypothetical protein
MKVTELYESLTEAGLKDKLKIALATKAKAKLASGNSTGWSADLAAIRAGTHPQAKEIIRYMDNAISGNGDPQVTHKLVIGLMKTILEGIKADKNKINDLKLLPKLKQEVTLAVCGLINKKYLRGSDLSDGRPLGMNTNDLIAKAIRSNSRNGVDHITKHTTHEPEENPEL